MITRGLLIGSMLLVAACGESEVAQEEELDVTIFDTAAVEAMLEAGNYAKALKVIKGQEEMGIADKDDFVLSAKIYNEFLDGVAAEVAVEKAREAGASVEETAIALARALLAQRRLDEASAALDAAVLKGEDAYQAILLRGDIARDQNDDEGARYFFRSAIDERPGDYSGYLGLAMLALSKGELEEADDFAKQAADQVDDDPVVRHVRGTIARYQGRMEDAVAHLRQAIELKSGFILALLELAGTYVDMGQLENARQQLDVVVAINPENPMAYYLSAQILAMEGKHEDAEYLLLRTGDLTREYPPASRVYGHVAFQLRKFSTARPYLERFLEIMPSDRLTRLALAESLSRRGEANRALVILEPLLAEGVADLEANMQAAAAHGALGNLAAARKSIERARALAISRGEEAQELTVVLTRRLALSRFVTGDREGAIAQLKQHFEDNHQDITSLNLLANMQIDSGDYDAALVSIEKLREQEPESALIPNLLGTIAYRQRNVEEALEHFNQALAQRNDYDSALKNRALAFLALQRFEEAKTDLEVLVEKAPNDGQVRGMYGRVLFELGDARRALEELKLAENALPQSAIIATDHALALSGLGYFSSAVAQGRKARRLATNDPKLQDYIGGLLAAWEQEMADRAAKEEEERLKRLEDYKKEQQELEEKRQKLLDEGSLKDAENPEGDGQEPSEEETEDDEEGDEPPQE